MSEAVGTSPDPALAAWADFRRARLAELTEPYGWLTLRGFHWLPGEPAAIAGLPGLWSANEAGASVTATAAEELLVEGTPLDGTHDNSVAETGRVPWVRWRDLDIELLNRGGRFAVRLRAATTPERETLTEVPTFPHDPAWSLPATYVPYAEPRRVEVATIRDDLRQRIWAYGDIHFEADGEPQTLTVTSIRSGLGVEFRDPTNGTETEQWRQLKFDDPAADGSVTLDFNYALNMWFAFTPYATCPAPLPGNKISVPVRAGELRPRL